MTSRHVLAVGARELVFLTCAVFFVRTVFAVCVTVAGFVLMNVAEVAALEECFFGTLSRNAVTGDEVRNTFTRAALKLSQAVACRRFVSDLASSSVFVKLSLSASAYQAVVMRQTNVFAVGPIKVLSDPIIGDATEPVVVTLFQAFGRRQYGLPATSILFNSHYFAALVVSNVNKIVEAVEVKRADEIHSLQRR